MARKYQFTEKTQSRRALIAIILSLVSLIGLILLIVGAVKNSGTSTVYVGSVGLFLLLVGIAGLFFAIRSLREENSFQTLPRIGLILSVLTCGSWIALYAWGFTL